MGQHWCQRSTHNLNETKTNSIKDEEAPMSNDNCNTCTSCQQQLLAPPMKQHILNVTQQPGETKTNSIEKSQESQVHSKEATLCSACERDRPWPTISLRRSVSGIREDVHNINPSSSTKQRDHYHRRCIHSSP